MIFKRLLLFITLLGFCTALQAQIYRNGNKSNMILRVLTYNIKGLPFTWIDHSRYEKIGQILKDRRIRSVGPHIVLIQEAFASKARELVKAAGYPYVSWGTRKKGTRIGSGLIILSEFPFSSEDRHVYTQCASWDCFSRKGAQHVRLMIPGLPHTLEVYNTHLNSGPEQDPGASRDTCDHIRHTQVQELREFIHNTRKKFSPSICGGDFNFKHNQYPYLSFVSFTHYKNAVKYCSDEGECIGDSDPGDYFSKRVDHQFYDKGIYPDMTLTPVLFQRVFTKKQKQYLSDHVGLEIHYRVAW